MGTLSVVIPTWSGTPALAEMAFALCEQVRPMCDELIVTEDGDFSQELEEFADIYQRNHPRLGHARNLAIGIELASGDFIGVLDSDITITKGTLRDLCVKGAAVCGVWKEFPDVTTLMGWCFVVDRELIRYHKIGLPEFEGLGNWVKGLEPYCLQSTQFEYSHKQKQSYNQKDRFGGKTLRELQIKEIDPARHKTRMLEDPIYRQRWENEY